MNSIDRPTRRPRPAVQTRVLVLTHSHPNLTHGGAEISAGALASGLQRQPGVTAWLVGCSRKPQTARLAINFTQPFGDRDYVYQASGSFDYFKYANNSPTFHKDIDELVAELAPEIIHFHHYSQFGVEAFSSIKRARPGVKIVLTMHEYLAICHAHGQMVKTKSLQLCEAESPIACSACFSEHSPRDFFLRKRYLQRFMAEVDLFIAPSQFLARRYIAWGLPADRVVVLANVPPARIDLAPIPPVAMTTAADTEISSVDRPLRVGFFGQMSPLKGILVLLAAAAELAADRVDGIRIDIYGDYSSQPPDFQEAVIDGLKLAGPNVRYHGPYRNENVLRLMSQMDAIVVPSIWWENSPVVIEEALAAGTPVLCSNIGGMAEKVREGIDGVWFEIGDHRDLAHRLLELQRNPANLQQLRRTMRRPPTVDRAVLAHLDAYAKLRVQAS